MRVIGEVPHSIYKITLFQWNGKFIIKIESGPMEQSYKIDEFDIQESAIPDLLDEDFMASVTKRFHMMYEDLQSSINRH